MCLGYQRDELVDQINVDSNAENVIALWRAPKQQYNNSEMDLVHTMYFYTCDAPALYRNM